jgi:hypothetical protein
VPVVDGSRTRPATDRAAARWLAEHPCGAPVEEVLAFFDRLPPVELGQLFGRWRGSGLPSGSPLDGFLEAYSWYGKEFVDEESAHPLLFADAHGRPRPLNPALLPVGLLWSRPRLTRLRPVRVAFGLVRPLLRTGHPRARLRAVEHRGVVTAAMVYDALPIIDVFRRVDAGTVLGLMDLRGQAAPFFFLLRRDAHGPGQPGREQREPSP